MDTAQTRTADRRKPSASACAAGLLLLCLGACGAEDDDGTLVAAQVYPIDASTPASGDAGVATPDAGPPPAYTATLLSATGSGCPAGTLRAAIGADGQISLTYDDFEVAVGEGAAEVGKDCQIVIGLSAKSGASYAVTKYAHHGHATLEKGAEGKQSSSYHFPSARSAGRLRNSILIGPLDAHVVSEPLGANDVGWTPCALEQQLRITNRLVLNRRGDGAKGTLTFAPEGDGSSGVSLALGVRACTLPAPR